MALEDNLTLSADHVKLLDGFASRPNDKSDSLALGYINNLQLKGSTAPLYKAALVKYYYQIKQEYRNKDIIRQLDVFDDL